METSTAASEDACSNLAMPMVVISEEAPTICNLPGKVVYFSKHGSDLMKVEVLLNGNPAMAILDTGASRSFISENLSDQLEVSISNERLQIQTVGDNDFNVLGSIKGSVPNEGGGGSINDQFFSLT